MNTSGENWTACMCDVCVAMCKRPCWPTPREAEQLLKLGYGDRMMIDWWVNGPDGKDIELLCPAMNGHEGTYAPLDLFITDGCALQREDGTCEVHDSGAKPMEARMAIHDSTRDWYGLHKEIAYLWLTDAAQAMVDKFRREME